MRHLITCLIISLIVTVLAWTSPFYSPGLELLLLPVMLVLLIIGLVGIGTLPFGLFKLIKKRPLDRWLTGINGVALGYYFGYLILIPIDNWDVGQRNLSGQIITEKLETYKESHGIYPDKLTDLDTNLINTALPHFYKLDRFNYYVQDNKFSLDIPIPIMDRWHWNDDKKAFDYIDW